ncbi:extensin-like [Actinidia eriantha]|uniref:extensin-like n=1 Tax=Actinidia eriantha TaxID=165200 RepID=UPI002589E6F2|nr:extensin-like [Actinidia eriantha]
MATSRPPSKPLDLDITIVSAKHLKNVNWRQGDLKPYAIFWVDPDRRQATKSDDSGSTRPVWNEHFLVPLTLPPTDSLLTLEIFHSKPSETPKPLVGSLRLPLSDLPDLDDPTRITTFELRRPSGRPHGKIRLKLAVRERPSPPAPDYHITPPPSYYYSSAPPPPYRGYSARPPPPSFATPPPPPLPHSYPYGSYSDPYSGYYGGYYSPQPPLPLPPPPRPFFDRQGSYGGPSAPVDYTPCDQKPKSGKLGGFGTGLAVGAVAGVLGGLALEEGAKREEEKVAERVESELDSRDDFTDYSNYHRVDYR